MFKETVWEQSEIRTLALADTHRDLSGASAATKWARAGWFWGECRRTDEKYCLLLLSAATDADIWSTERQSTDEESEGSWEVIGRHEPHHPFVVVYLSTRYLILFWACIYTRDWAPGHLNLWGRRLNWPESVLAGGYLSDGLPLQTLISVICLFVLAPLLLFFDDLPPTRIALGLGFFAIGFFIYIPDSLVSAQGD